MRGFLGFGVLSNILSEPYYVCQVFFCVAINTFSRIFVTIGCFGPSFQFVVPSFVLLRTDGSIRGGFFDMIPIADCYDMKNLCCDSVVLLRPE